MGEGDVDGVGVGVGEAVGVGLGEAVGDGVGDGEGANCMVWTMPEILPEAFAVNWKFTLEVTWLTVTVIPVWTCGENPSAVAVTL